MEAPYACEFRCVRNDTQHHQIVGSKNDERWHIALQCPPTPVTSNNVPGPAATSSLEETTTTYTINSLEHDVEIAEITDGEVDARRRESLPWEQFLPIETHARRQSRIGACGGASDFDELLEEGKKRLENAEREELLRERAEAVGHMGGGALADLLVDLREPTFSRRQNE